MSQSLANDHRIAYLNGDFLPISDAKISILDRAALFADAVYEVNAIVDGKIIDFDGHMTRLRRSLNELSIVEPDCLPHLLAIYRELIARNTLAEGAIYLQVSRGVADRSFVIPSKLTPTVTLFTQAYTVVDNPVAKQGIRVITLDDLRWHRCDIKTVQLLYPSLAKSEALARGADDAWLVRDGRITEGTSNNAFIIKDQQIITRQLSNDILHGITRKTVLALAEREQLDFIERAFGIDEAQQADEAFYTSASGFVMPVIQVNDHLIGDGSPGALTRKLRSLYIQNARETAI